MHFLVSQVCVCWDGSRVGKMQCFREIVTVCYTRLVLLPPSLQLYRDIEINPFLDYIASCLHSVMCTCQNDAIDHCHSLSGLPRIQIDIKAKKGMIWLKVFAFALDTDLQHRYLNQD